MEAIVHAADIQDRDGGVLLMATRDCRNFRVWAGMMGEETPHGPTQGALHS